ncbi:MAG: hypothetical protein JWO35_47 [Candidatus Saccharibacteria bacterium]|nr:hypothetical protein [Candidatus Saccharibacteria bacterium]
METIPSKQIHIVGGGTIEPIRSHLALSAPAYGNTARQLGALCQQYMPEMDIQMHLTKMANAGSDIETSDDLRNVARQIVGDYASKLVFWSPMICDFRGSIGDGYSDVKLDSHKPYAMLLEPNPKIIPMLRKEGLDGQRPRKDIFAVGFKTTVGAPPDQQYSAGLRLLKQNSLNLVLANDARTRNNMVITPEEAFYHESTDRAVALKGLVEIAALRSQMSFTESTVVAGEAVPWNSQEVFPALRAVVNHCIDGGAYKPFLGVTAGHFAAKLNERTFLTSRRKTNFNELGNIGLVKVETDGDDKVIAYGSKPSVGGQSQRIVFEQHPGKDCIVHFHSPIKPGSQIPVVSQREYECGSHQCGENTSRGLGSFEEGAIEAVYLDQHGPNIVFDHNIDPQKVINFIEENFDLQAKTGGYVPES